MDLGRVFGHAGVAGAYRHRPPYPAEVFTILHDLAVDTPRAVLDLGAGEGALARPLAAWADRVDAVELAETTPVTFRQSVDDYIEQFHSTASLAREHMTPAEAATFADSIRAAVTPWAADDLLELPIVATIHWGRPRPG